MPDPLDGAKLTPEATDPLRGYRPYATSAVVAVALGLFSWLPLCGALLWPVPLVALAVALLALRRIRLSGGSLAGRGLALLGLALAVFFAVAVASHSVTIGIFLERDARPFSRHWLEQLLDREPHRAHQLTREPQSRVSLRDDLWEEYRSNDFLRQALETFVEEPLPRYLLACGDRLKIRFVGTEWRQLRLAGQALSHVYAVTHVDERGEALTFFARVVVARTRHPQTGMFGLTVQRFEAGVRPFTSRVMDEGPAAYD